MKTIAFAGATLALLAATSPVSAQTAWQVGNHGFHVYFNDLDLASRNDRAVALARVEKAAAKLCRALPLAKNRKACIEDAVQRSVKAGDNRMLARALDERGPTMLAAK